MKSAWAISTPTGKSISPCFTTRRSGSTLNRQSNANHWIKLKIGWAQNRLGIGSRITVYESGTNALIGYDEVRTDVCYRSRRSTTLHFGLGNAKKVDVHVVTPNGRQQLFEKLATNEFHILNLKQ